MCLGSLKTWLLSCVACLAISWHPLPSHIPCLATCLALPHAHVICRRFNYMHMHMHVWGTHMHVLLQAHVLICTDKYINTCLDILIYVYIYRYIYTHIYTFI